MKYLKTLYELLTAIGNGNTEGVMDFSNEFMNLVSDKVKISDYESEVAEEMAKDLEFDLEDAEYGE